MLAARKHLCSSATAASPAVASKRKQRYVAARVQQSRSDTEPFAQLATAKIPDNVNAGVFNNTM